MIVVINKGVEIIVSECDRHLFDGTKWNLLPSGAMKYVRKTFKQDGKTKNVSLHRLIMSAEKGQIVDHINGNTLDNRRENLRFVTREQNARNAFPKFGKKDKTSRFGGVALIKGVWRVRIRYGGENHTIGTFRNEVEAAYRFDLASLENHGEFGKRNFLPLVL